MSLDIHFQLSRGDFMLDATFCVPARGITALFGPSGCGKTTLLRAIAGLEPQARGHCRIGDDTWQDHQRRLPAHRRPLGFVFQEASLFSHLSVRGNLEYGLRRIPVSERRIDVAQAVDLLGLAPLLTRRPEGLSGGERQRVAIGRALLTSPRLLLMDEPLAALDQRRKQEILPFFERLHRELSIPILYVSHAADEVARLADHLVLLADGRVQASGPISEMLTRVDLPLAHEQDAAAVVEATVDAVDDAYHLAHLRFTGGELVTPNQELATGEQLRVRILARDVSLTLARQTDTSILNIVPVTVTALDDEGPAQLLARLDAGGVPLLARITRRSANALALAPGKGLYAQIKAVSLLC